MKNFLTIAILFLCFIACNSSQPKSISSGKSVQIDANPAECPYITNDNNGNTVISWVRMINDSVTALCYAKSGDGKTFSSPIVIPNSGNIQPHGENMPKIIFKPSGEILALWGAANPNPKNKYSGIVFYTQSFDNGGSWTPARPLVSDTASYDQRYYDVALMPDGEAGIIWLDNRKSTKKEGSALYFSTTKGKNGFDQGRLIAEQCCQCCRTDLYVDKKGGIHALFRGVIEDSIRDMVHIVSNDRGKSFSTPKRISDDNWVIKGCPHTGPAMTENNDGIHFAWFTGGKNKGCYYTKSTDNGQTFTMRDTISSLGTHPQLASMSDGELLIVWDEAYMKDNKLNKLIGMQRRNAEGNPEGKEYITNGNILASYPVIGAVNDSSSIVAYLTKKGEKNFVAYQVLKLK